MKRSALVISHYRADLDWLLKVPEHFDIYLYDKGQNKLKRKIANRCVSIQSLPNTGLDPHTHLHHIQSGAGRDTERTVFSQDDPFEHSPDFLALLQISPQWNPTQALSYCWKVQKACPPSFVLEREIGDYLSGNRVRREIFSLSTWTPFSFHCLGSIEQGTEYLRTYGLPGGWNIAGHFLEMCGMDALAEAAWQAQLGKFAYGAIFATETKRLEWLDERAVNRMLVLCRAYWLYPLILERLWLHFFGEPFIKLS